ncbi:MAG TPA: tetratricopeptide repeat protein, partial [Gemmataceae bacterium]|nr:tetratricopeptide repeat protein [Gemmataceae bacterium]
MLSWLAGTSKPANAYSTALNAMNRASTKSVTNDRNFQGAVAALQLGNLNDAERLFEAVLRAEPKHVGALNLMGVVLTQLRRFSDAESY